MWLLNPYRFGGLFLLDLYPGAAAAYSLRLLRSAYTGPVIRVRRSSDNTEQDFTATQVGDGTLTAFCGAGNGFVRTWYDQSGNGHHAANTATSEQPQIVSSGASILENGKPCIRFDGSNKSLDANSLAASFSGTNRVLHALTVCKSSVTNAPTNITAWGLGNAANDIPIRLIGQLVSTNSCRFDQRNDANALASISGGTITAQALFYAQSSASLTRLRANGLQVSSGSGLGGAVTLNRFSIGCLSRTAKVLFWNGTMQELALYATDMTSSQNGLESDINAHYSIY